VLEAICVLLQIKHQFILENSWIDQPLRSDIRLTGTLPVQHAIQHGFGFGGIYTAIIWSAQHGHWN